MNLTHIKELVVRPALAKLAVALPALSAGPSEPLMIGTGLAESAYAFLRQYPSGPAIGFWEMEAGGTTTTYEDTWHNFLAYQPSLSIILRTIAGVSTGIPDPLTMAWNLQFACAMARIKYYRSPLPLPASTAMALATYHKQVYNTGEGVANVLTNEPLFVMALAA